MKAALHFLADDTALQGNYPWRAFQLIAGAIFRPPRIDVHTKVFVGDLGLMRLGLELAGDPKHPVSRHFLTQAVDHWLSPASTTWQRLDPEIADLAQGHTLFAVCFESADPEAIAQLHARLVHGPAYVGALEVDDVSPAHWYLYSRSLVPWLRVAGTTAYQLCQTLTDDEKNPALLRALREWGFAASDYESLSGRYSIFDAYQSYEHARKVAQWKRRFGSMLAFLADHAVSRLSDSAPDLGNRLFAALDTFERAETNEQYAQVASTCRRLFEYVVDQLYPPRKERVDDHELGPGKHRNRVRAFAEQERASGTNLELVLASLDVWSDQVDKLNALTNKGVHGTVFRDEARRCMIRTVMLLDDLASFRPTPFEHKGHIDTTAILGLLRRRPDGGPA